MSPSFFNEGMGRIDFCYSKEDLTIIDKISNSRISLITHTFEQRIFCFAPGLSLENVSGRVYSKPDSIDSFCCSIQVEDFEGEITTQECCGTIIPYTDMKSDVNADCVSDFLDAVFFGQ